MRGKGIRQQRAFRQVLVPQALPVPSTGKDSLPNSGSRSITQELVTKSDWPSLLHGVCCPLSLLLHPQSMLTGGVRPVPGPALAPASFQLFRPEHGRRGCTTEGGSANPEQCQVAMLLT